MSAAAVNKPTGLYNPSQLYLLAWSIRDRAEPRRLGAGGAIRATEGSRRARRAPPPRRARRMRDPPYRAVAVFGEDERAVLHLGDADRAAPDRGIIDHEADDEILVLAGGHAVLHDPADDLVAGALGPVPGPVLGGEDAALVFGRELVAGVDHHPERGRMRLDQNVGHSDLVLEVGPRSPVARVLVGADVIPGPAVEGAFAHAGDVVGREIIAEAIALVGRAPKLAGHRVHRHADAIADAGCESSLALALRIEDEHVGAVGLGSPGRAQGLLLLPPAERRLIGSAQAVAGIGGGAHRDEHPRAVLGEDDVAGRVTSGREPGDDNLRPAVRLHLAAAIGEADDGVGFSDMGPLRIVGRME